MPRRHSRAYAADLANYKAWCGRHGFEPMPATPEIVGAYLAAAGVLLHLWSCRTGRVQAPA
jgi:hypothetical protein